MMGARWQGGWDDAAGNRLLGGCCFLEMIIVSELFGFFIDPTSSALKTKLFRGGGDGLNMTLMSFLRRFLGP